MGKTGRENKGTGKGAVAAVLASLLYGILPMLSVFSMSGVLSAEQMVFWRFLFSAVSAFAAIKVTGKSLKITKRQFLFVAALVLAGFGTTELLLTTSYTYLPTGLATMFHFTYPLLVILFGALIYREKITKAKGLAVLCILLGMLLITDLTGRPSLPGILFALGSGAAYASFILGNRAEAIGEVDPLVMVFYGMIVNTLVFGIFVGMTSGIVLPVSFTEWGSIIAGAALCTVAPIVLMAVAIREMGASRTALINMLEPVTGVVCGLLFLGEKLNGKTGIGMLLVLAGSFITELWGGREAPESHGKKNA